MGLITRTVGTGLVGLLLVAGCAKDKEYAPAVASPASIAAWKNTPLITTTPPPEDLRYQPQQQRSPLLNPAALTIPTQQQWSDWQAAASQKEVCRGKGKKRSCKLVTATVVDKANTMAVIKPSALHVAYGQSMQIRFPLEGMGMQLYEIPTSPVEFTRLLLPLDEPLAFKLGLNPQAWEVRYGETIADGARQEVVAVRPKDETQVARDMLVFKSGLGPLYLWFKAQVQPGALSVTWDAPTPGGRKKPELNLQDLPPKFNKDAAYAKYTLTVDSKHHLAPQWMPKAIVDDGKNTLVVFKGHSPGFNLPVVSAIQPNGKLGIVQSRFYVNTRNPHEDAYIYLAGIHAGLELRDYVGIKVTAIREVPDGVQEVKHVQ